MGEIVVKKRNRRVAFLAGLLALNVLPACQVGNRMTSSVAGSSSSEAVLEEESELEEQEENSESLSEETPEPSGTEEPEIENRAAEAQEEEIPEEPDGYEIEDFPILWQMPELPTGCEITALTMTLQYYGFDVDKVTMAEEYLPTVLARFYYDSEGNLCGPNKWARHPPGEEPGLREARHGCSSRDRPSLLHEAPQNSSDTAGCAGSGNRGPGARLCCPLRPNPCRTRSSRPLSGRHMPSGSGPGPNPQCAEPSRPQRPAPAARP